jgi:hypothetical protein
MTKPLKKPVWLYLLAAGLVQVSGLISPVGSHLLAQRARPEENRINVETLPGADLGEKLAYCIRLLGPNGGTCDARSISGSQTAKADPFAGSDGIVKVLLGWQVQGAVQCCGWRLERIVISSGMPAERREMTAFQFTILRWMATMPMRTDR